MGSLIEVKSCGGVSKLTLAVIRAVREINEAGHLATFTSVCDNLSREFSMNHSQAELSRLVQRCCTQAVAVGRLSKDRNSFSIPDGKQTVVQKCPNQPASRSHSLLLLDKILAKKV